MGCRVFCSIHSVELLCWGFVVKVHGVFHMDGDLLWGSLLQALQASVMLESDVEGREDNEEEYNIPSGRAQHDKTPGRPRWRQELRRREILLKSKHK